MPRHEARRLAYFRARNRLVTGLRALGFSVPVVPEGAFYVYATLPPEQPDSESFCRALLERAAVAATPGTDFGVQGAARSVRFSYTAPLGDLEEALTRLEAFLAGRPVATRGV
jgi:aspartate/methionine/tyrosine aminotransferase